VRPGQSPDGGLLLPLEKSRGSDDAPAFAVEILYLTKATAWEEKGKEKLILPALDLPISRTGLLLYYPPLFHVSAEPGTFRLQEYQNPTSVVLEPPASGPTGAMGGMAGGIGRGSVAGIARLGAGSAPPKDFDQLQQFAQLQAADKDLKKETATQALLDSYRAKSSAGRVTGILPINVSFPAFGPSIYLVSELTGENQSSAAEFSFARDKKGGVR
jgi:hypothetical protein